MYKKHVHVLFLSCCTCIWVCPYTPSQWLLVRAANHKGMFNEHLQSTQSPFWLSYLQESSTAPSNREGEKNNQQRKPETTASSRVLACSAPLLVGGAFVLCLKTVKPETLLLRHLFFYFLKITLFQFWLHQVFSSCEEWGILSNCDAPASYRGGSSCCRAQL